MRKGKCSDSIIKRSVLKKCRDFNETMVQGPGEGRDCAIFHISGKTEETAAVCSGTTELDSCRRIRHLLFHLACNLLCGGKRAEFVTVQLTCPESMEERELKVIMDGLVSVCKELEITLAGGHTTVSGAVSVPILSASMFGMQSLYMEPEALESSGENAAVRTAETPGNSEDTGTAEIAEDPQNSGNSEKKERAEGKTDSGFDLVMTGFAGNEGTALLTEKYREQISGRFPLYLTEQAAGADLFLFPEREAAIAWKSGAAGMHDVSEGGIFGALWEFCEQRHCGMDVYLKKIPILQETIEVCEIVGRNPYNLWTGGSLLIAVPDGKKLLERYSEEGIRASLIGRLTEKKERILHNGEEIRYLDKPAMDEWLSMGKEI